MPTKAYLLPLLGLLTPFFVAASDLKSASSNTESLPLATQPCEKMLSRPEKTSDFHLSFKRFATFEEVSRIDLSWFDLIAEVPFEIGLGTEKTLKGMKDGKVYFVKVSTASATGGWGTRHLRDVLNEASWASSIHSQLGLGPKFYGATIVDGNYAMVYDWIEGSHLTRLTTELPFTLSADQKGSVIRQMYETTQKLLDAGIYPKDLQLRVTPAGQAVLIDTEKFQFLSGFPDPVVFGDLRPSLERLTKIINALKPVGSNSQ